MNFIAPDLMEGSEMWTAINAKCAELVAANPPLGTPLFRGCLINRAIAELGDSIAPRNRGK